MRTEKRKLTEKDICVIIATYNRASDIEKTLFSLVKNKNIPGKIVIVDQSKDNGTKKIVVRYKKKLPIEYMHCRIPSADISMNIGIKKYRKKFPLILTAGDDVDFLKDYMKNITREFNSHPDVMAIGGVNYPEKYNFDKLKNKMSNLLLRIFFLPFRENQKFRITSAYGHTSSPVVKGEIRDAQWIPGFNTCWRSQIYEKYLWPEIRGYNVIDDIDSSYRVYKKYGKGSLVITTKCKVYHRWSKVGRYAEKKRIFVNHEDHFSFYYMHFENFKGKLKIVWSLVGIIIGNFFRFIAKPSKLLFLNLKYNIEAIAYCYKNRENIKNKKYRIFLDENLNMKI